MPLVGRRQARLDPLEEPVLLVLVVVVRRPPGQLDRRVDEERAEEVEDPANCVDRRRADRDEDAAHHQGQHDADHQRRLLELLRHRELGHDDEEDEQVVDRQRVLGQPAGEELAAVLVPRRRPDAEAEQRRRDRRTTRARSPPPSRGLVRAAAPMMKTSKSRNTAIVTPMVRPPDPGGNVHGAFRAFRSRVHDEQCRRSLPPGVRRTGGPGTAARGPETVMTRTAAKEYSPPCRPSLPDRRGSIRIDSRGRCHRREPAATAWSARVTDVDRLPAPRHRRVRRCPALRPPRTAART